MSFWEDAATLKARLLKDAAAISKWYPRIAVQLGLVVETIPDTKPATSVKELLNRT